MEAQEASPLAGVRNVPGTGHPDTAFLGTTVGGLGQSRVLLWRMRWGPGSHSPGDGALGASLTLSSHGDLKHLSMRASHMPLLSKCVLQVHTKAQT